MKNFILSTIVLIASALFGLNLKSQNSILLNIDEFIQEQMQNNHVPGLSAAIIVGDSIVWYNSYGYLNLEDSIPVNDSTMYNVFSIGKTVTAACVMQLWDDSILGLDQNINDFLPFQVENSWNGADSVTARMLMSHSSSISDNGIEDLILPGDPTISLEYYMENLLIEGGEYYSMSNFYNMQPGANFHYCTHGPALTGYLVEEISGLDFHLYAKEALLTPLEMPQSAWFLDELNIENLAIGYKYQSGNFIPRPHRGHPAYPGFFLRSNALELANFVTMLLNHGEFKGQTILSNAAVDSMTCVQDPGFTFQYGTAGLGLFVREDLGERVVWGHNGGSIGGYAAQIYFCKEENKGVVITTNSEQYLDELVEYMFDYITNIKTPKKTIFNLNITPNPVSLTTTIRFELNKTTFISIQIFNSTGEIISDLKNGIFHAGTNQVSWNSNAFKAGIYFCRIQVGNETMTRKIIKVK